MDDIPMTSLAASSLETLLNEIENCIRVEDFRAIFDKQTAKILIEDFISRYNAGKTAL